MDTFDGSTGDGSGVRFEKKCHEIDLKLIINTVIT